MNKNIFSDTTWSDDVDEFYNQIDKNQDEFLSWDQTAQSIFFFRMIAQMDRRLKKAGKFLIED